MKSLLTRTKLEKVLKIYELDNLPIPNKIAVIIWALEQKIITEEQARKLLGL